MAPTATADSEWITLAETARRWGVHRETALRIIRRTGVRSRQFPGGLARYSVADITAANSSATRPAAESRDGAA